MEMELVMKRKELEKVLSFCKMALTLAVYGRLPNRSSKVKNRDL